jgi:hypothetical protein
MKLGEAIAIGILKDQRACYNEVFNGFSQPNSTGPRSWFKSALLDFDDGEAAWWNLNTDGPAICC